MLQYCWVLLLSNEPKHINVGPAVTEPIDFLSRTVEFWDIAPYSQAQLGVRDTQNAAYRRVRTGVILRCYALPVLFSLHISYILQTW